jgi:hypothetical protein
MFARAKGRPLRLRLELNSGQLGQTETGNVVGEILERNPALPPVLLNCHLDSWRNAPGAVDNAAGCGIISAAACHVAVGDHPLRSLRV